ncbi:hypothetical protein ACFLU6_13985 [Acidobacteriota bacterium]
MTISCVDGECKADPDPRNVKRGDTIKFNSEYPGARVEIQSNDFDPKDVDVVSGIATPVDVKNDAALGEHDYNLFCSDEHGNECGFATPKIYVTEDGGRVRLTG